MIGNKIIRSGNKIKKYADGGDQEITQRSLIRHKSSFQDYQNGKKIILQLPVIIFNQNKRHSEQITKRNHTEGKPYIKSKKNICPFFQKYITKFSEKRRCVTSPIEQEINQSPPNNKISKSLNIYSPHQLFISKMKGKQPGETLYPTKFKKSIRGNLKEKFQQAKRSQRFNKIQKILNQSSQYISKQIRQSKITNKNTDCLNKIRIKRFSVTNKRLFINDRITINRVSEDRMDEKQEKLAPWQITQQQL